MNQQRQKCVVALKAVNHYTRLPDGKLIEVFIEKITKKYQEKPSRYCFLVGENIIDIYLMICFCFGKLQFIQKIKNKKIISEDTKKQLDQLGQKFIYDNQSPFIIFQKNAEIFGRFYPRYYKEILQHFKQSESEEYFKQIINNDLLHQVKIRLWNQKQNQKEYKKYQRKNQDYQVFQTSQLIYLLITKSDNSYNVGFIELQKLPNNRQSFYTISNQLDQSVLKDSPVQKIQENQNNHQQKQPQLEMNFSLPLKKKQQKKGKQLKNCYCQMI